MIVVGVALVAIKFESPIGLEKTTILAPGFDLFVNSDCCFS